MRKKTRFKIGISFLVLCLCSFSAFAYAIGPEVPGKRVEEDPHAPGVPVTELKDSENKILPPKATNSVADSITFLCSGSKANLETPSAGVVTSMAGQQDAFTDRSAQSEISPILAKEPSEQEVSALVDGVLFQVVEAGLETDLSTVLAYISREDYSGLAGFQKENPEILNKINESLQAISATYSRDDPRKGYIDNWLEEIKRAQENQIKSQQVVGNSGVGSFKEDPLIERAEKLYEPIAKRISQINKSFSKSSRVPEESGVQESASGDLLKNFSGKAKKFILNSLNRAQTNLANGMLSSPFETTAFAMETTTIQTSSSVFDQTAVRKMTIAERYIKSKRYQVVDSVYIGKDFLYAQKMLHPPTNLHPYLKWLLYTRNLTPRMVENYLATREAVGVIYEQAKAGRGNIRYRDKVYGAFLPFAETAAGNYELVKPASIP